MKNKEILWSQGCNETDSDYMIIDGAISRYTGTSEQTMAVSVLQSDGSLTLCKHNKRRKTSPSFKVRKKCRWTIIDGNYEEKDDSNRHRVYSIAIRSHRPDKVISSLLSNSKKIGCTPMNGDAAVANETLKIFNTISLILVLCAIVMIIAICL